MSQRTLKKRIKEYTTSGFLQGWEVFVNPVAVQSNSAQVHLDVWPTASKQDVIRKLRLIDGVWYIANYHGNDLGVGLYYDDGDSLKSRLELMARIANSEHVAHGQVLFPPCGYRFRPTDLAIIRSVRGGPWQTYASIAKQTRISTRTVRRRLARMIADRALFVAPLLDFKCLKGVIGADLFVFYVNKRAAATGREKILSVISNDFVFAAQGPDHSYYALLLENVSQLSEIQNRVKDFEEVRDAYVELIEDHLSQHRTHKAKIERLSQQLEILPTQKERFRSHAEDICS
jgi:DNA-binding Lrp family transcriptional regulator